MKKNIFYFSPYFLPESNAAAVRNYWFVKTLREDGHTVRLVTGKDLAFKLPKNTDSAIKRLLKEQLAGLALAFKVLFSKNDLYIFSSPPFFTVMTGALACKLLGKKYILDIRDIYPEVLADTGLISQDSLPYKYLKWFTRYLYLGAHRVISVTKGFVGKIQEYDSKIKTELIYNGYDGDLFKPSAEKFEKTTVVFHGNLGKFQRIDLLVEVAKQMEKSHPDIQFKVIGRGPGEKYLQNPPRNLEYLGPMKYQEVAAYIAKCHIGISLRTDDDVSRTALPVKVFEYMGVGIPMVVTPIGEASNLIMEHGVGLASVNDVHAVCQNIETVMRSHTDKGIKVANGSTRQEQSKKILPLLN